MISGRIHRYRVKYYLIILLKPVSLYQNSFLFVANAEILRKMRHKILITEYGFTFIQAMQPPGRKRQRLPFPGHVMSICETCILRKIIQENEEVT